MKTKWIKYVGLLIMSMLILPACAGTEQVDTQPMIVNTPFGDWQLIENEGQKPTFESVGQPILTQLICSNRQADVRFVFPTEDSYIDAEHPLMIRFLVGDATYDLKAPIDSGIASDSYTLSEEVFPIKAALNMQEMQIGIPRKSAGELEYKVISLDGFAAGYEVFSAKCAE